MLNVRNAGLEFTIMGDFNYDLKILAGMNLDFLNFMSSHDLYPVVTVPTRITEHSTTFINILSCFVTSSSNDMCRSYDFAYLRSPASPS